MLYFSRFSNCLAGRFALLELFGSVFYSLEESFLKNLLWGISDQEYSRRRFFEKSFKKMKKIKGKFVLDSKNTENFRLRRAKIEENIKVNCLEISPNRSNTPPSPSGVIFFWEGGGTVDCDKIGG